MGLRTLFSAGVLVTASLVTAASAGNSAIGETPGNTTGTGLGSGTPGGYWEASGSRSILPAPVSHRDILVERLGAEVDPDAAIAYSVGGFRKWPVIEVRMAKGADLVQVNREILEIGQGLTSDRGYDAFEISRVHCYKAREDGFAARCSVTLKLD